MPRKIDLTGQRFGRLVVLQEAGHNRSKKTRWICRCDCGAAVTTCTAYLRNGDTTSCGCGATSNGLTHGHKRMGKASRTYRIWSGMLTRCTNKNAKDYKFYGGKGISVCDRWHDFENFLHDMGEAPAGASIDRIDANRGYEPSNCRWLEHAENSRRAVVERWKQTKERNS